MKLLWSPTASRHLDQLFAYIAEANPDAAAATVRTIVDAAELLREFPHLARFRLTWRQRAIGHPPP
jgi:plasmid stabilization system protein ParE